MQILGAYSLLITSIALDVYMSRKRERETMHKAIHDLIIDNVCIRENRDKILKLRTADLIKHKEEMLDK